MELFKHKETIAKATALDEPDLLTLYKELKTGLRKKGFTRFFVPPLSV